MLRTDDTILVLRNSIILGAMATVFILIACGEDANFSSPAILLPLFISALLFGVRGAFISLLAGVLPALVVGEDYPGALRIAVLTMCVGGAAAIAPRIPGYLATLSAWMLLVLPLRELFFPLGSYRTGALATQFWEHHVLLCCFTDVLISLVAGAFALNPSIKCFITRKPYTPNITGSFVHTLTLTALLSALGVIVTLNRLGVFSQNRFAESNLWMTFGLFTTFVCMPTIIGIRLSMMVTPRRGGLLNEHGLTPRSHGSAEWNEWLNKIPEELFDSLNYSSHEVNTDANKRGVCAIDEAGKVIFMNDQFRAAANIVLPGTIGQDFSQLGGESLLIAELARLISFTPPDRDLTTECRIEEGKNDARFFEVNIRGHAQNISEENCGDADGNAMTPRVVTVNDISSRRTIERHQLISQRLQSLSTFITTAAESIGNYCATIMGRASFVDGEPGRTFSQDSLREIVCAAQSAGRLAAQLAQFGGNPARARVQEIVDVRSLIRDNLNLLQTTAGDTSPVILETEANEGYSAVDPQLLMQALIELIKNSKDAYQGKAGSIKISVSREEIDEVGALLHQGTSPGAFIRIRVTDQGVGMSKEELARYTAPSVSTSQEASGALPRGFTSVFTIARAHDGFMTIESKTNQGTTVSLYLPMRIPLATQAEIMSIGDDIPHEPSYGSGSVLIAERHDELREALSDMVTSLGYTVTACRNPEEAQQALLSSPCDIVLLDDNLDNSRSSAFLASIRSDFVSVKTVRMTTSSLVHGCISDAVIQKPFDLLGLSHALSMVSDNRIAPRENGGNTFEETDDENLTGGPL